MQELASLLPLVAIAALFYLLLIRPQARRQRDQREMQASLAVGDEVMLTSGIYGVLRSLGDDRVRIEVAAGTVLEVARGAVGQRVSPSEEPAAGLERPHDTDDTTGER